MTQIDRLSSGEEELSEYKLKLDLGWSFEMASDKKICKLRDPKELLQNGIPGTRRATIALPEAVRDTFRLKSGSW
jgi:hypothetical protein